MSGLEILGAIASAVQLATSCYQLQKRVRMRSGDKVLSSTINTECGILINEIDKHILTLSADSREAMQHLRDRLTAIRSRIERRQTTKSIIKGITVLQLYGSSDKDDFLVALQEYQTHVGIIETAAINEFLSHASRSVVTPELESLGLSITSALTALGHNMTQTENQFRSINSAIEGVDGKMDAALSQLSDISCEVKRSNNAVHDLRAMLKDTMKGERALARENVPVRGLFTTLGQVDRCDLQVDFGTMKWYLESIVQGGGWPSDLDVWECICDVVETVSLLGSSAGSRSRDFSDTVAVEAAGNGNIVYFSPMIPPLWDSLGTSLHPS
jgi:hypothetical protein